MGRISLLTLLLAGCADQIVPLSDPSYQPSATAEMNGPPLNSSITLVGQRPWTAMQMDRIRTTTYVTGGSESIRIPAVIWGPVLQQDMLAEFQAMFQSAQAAPVVTPNNGTTSIVVVPSTDLCALVEVHWEDLAQPNNQLGAARLFVHTSIIANRTNKQVAAFNDSILIQLPFGGNQQAGQAIQAGIAQLSHNFGRLLARDQDLRSKVELGYFSGTPQPAVAAANTPYQAAMDGVVSIQQGTASGSGIILSSGGLVLTSARVVAGTQPPLFKTHQGGSYGGDVIAVDRDRDLALVQLRQVTSPLPVLRLSSGEIPAAGSGAVAIGSPDGLNWSVAKGTISAVRQMRVAKMVQFDHAMDQGGFGSPLIDPTSGQVIGVFSFNDGTNSFAVQADEARKAFGGKIPG